MKDRVAVKIIEEVSCCDKMPDKKVFLYLLAIDVLLLRVYDMTWKRGVRLWICLVNSISWFIAYKKLAKEVFGELAN